MKKSRFSVELLKQLFYVVIGVLWTLIKTNWRPLYTTSVKTCFVAALIYLITYIPSPVAIYLSMPGFLGWVSIILVCRLLTLKYDDFETPDDELEEEDIDATTNDLAPPIAPNIVSPSETVNNDPTATTSTRE